MHHHVTYMYINFQQNRANRSAITVHTNVFVKNRKLHEFATASYFFKKRLFQTCIIVKRTCISIFSQIGLVDQSKPCTQIYLQNNLQLEFQKNNAFRTCTTPLRTFMLILRSIGLLDFEIPRKEIISTDGQTVVFSKKEKTTKNDISLYEKLLLWLYISQKIE